MTGVASTLGLLFCLNFEQQDRLIDSIQDTGSHKSQGYGMDRSILDTYGIQVLLVNYYCISYGPKRSSNLLPPPASRMHDEA